MRNKSRIATLVAFVLVGSLAFAEPWASITFAEGKTFSVVRNGKSSVYAAESAQAIGLELQRGDILQTAGSTYLEVFITGVSAAVQVAENTSFMCDSDETGTKVSGDLHYGRVRAKVAKLAGASSFKITTPTLVAGVRGTDFGCDVIAVRGAKAASGSASPSASAPVVNRVFCFEGSVAVTPSPDIVKIAETSQAPVPVPVVIGKNEMVQNVVDTSSPAAVVQPLAKESLTPEVNDFWSDRPIVSPVQPTSLRVPGTFANLWPKGSPTLSSARNLKVAGLASATLIVVGSALCVGAAAYSSNVDSGLPLVDPLYAGGAIMAGSGFSLALLSSLFD